MLNKYNDYTAQDHIVFPSKIRFHKHLTFGEKVFMAEIIAMQGCEFSPKDLAQFFNVSSPTIINWVTKLISLNLIDLAADKDNPRIRMMIRPKSLDEIEPQA
jgi:DNA-binding MarR family transcriptional regulator